MAKKKRSKDSSESKQPSSRGKRSVGPKRPPGFLDARYWVIQSLENEEHEKDYAERAIESCPQSIEGYMRLAELEPSPEKVAEIYRKAVSNCTWYTEATISDLADPDSDFAVYLRCRVQMSDHLWNYGQRVDSVEHLQELQAVDPEDYSEAAFRLGFRLFDLGWDEELAELLGACEFGKPGAAFALLLAFVTFCNHGDCDAARESIGLAHRLNPSLMDYLLGDGTLQFEEWLEYTEPDEIAEAIQISSIALPIARNQPKLLRWIRETIHFKSPERMTTREDRQLAIQSLTRLGQVEETWILGMQRAADLWIVLVYSLEEEMTVRIESFESKPSKADLWDMVMDSMRAPNGEPRRPKKLIVSSSTLAKDWNKRCAKLSIDCVVDPEKPIPPDLYGKYAELFLNAEESVELSEDLLQRVESLPQLDRHWLLGIYQPPLWITDQVTPRRPVMAVVMDAEIGIVLMQEISDTLDDQLIINALFKCFERSFGDLGPHRPRSIHVHAFCDWDRDEVELLLERLNIDLIDATSVEQSAVEEYVEELIRNVGGPENRDSLIDHDGVTPEDVGTLFQSAARFWKNAPWRIVPGDRAIEIRSPLFQGTTWYAVVVGQMGMNLGLVMYESKEALDAVMMYSDEAVPDGVFLNFLEKFEIPAIDLWFQEKYEWTIAGDEAYPLLERALPEHQFRRPNRHELLAMDVALRIIPAFVSRPEGEGMFRLPVHTMEKRGDVEARWIEW